MVISCSSCIRLNSRGLVAGVFITISIAHRDPDHGTAVQLEPRGHFEGTLANSSYAYPTPSSGSILTSGLAELDETSASRQYFNKDWIRSLAQLTHIIVDKLPDDAFWKSFDKSPKEFTTDMIMYVLHAEDGDRYRRLVHLTPHEFDDFRQQDVAKEKIIGDEKHYSEFDKTLLRMVNDIYPHEVTAERLTSAWFATDLQRIEKMIEIAKNDWHAHGGRERTKLPGDEPPRPPPAEPVDSFDAELSARPAPIGMHSEDNEDLDVVNDEEDYFDSAGVNWHNGVAPHSVHGLEDLEDGEYGYFEEDEDDYS